MSEQAWMERALTAEEALRDLQAARAALGHFRLQTRLRGAARHARGRTLLAALHTASKRADEVIEATGGQRATPRV